MSQADLEHRLLTGLERVGSVLRTLRRERAMIDQLTVTQARVLRILVRRLPVGMRGVDLAAELGVSRASEGQTVSVLATRGLARQRRDKQDGRVKRIQLTPKGLKVAARIDRWDENAKQALAVLGADDQATLLQQIVGVIQGLEAVGLIPEARVCPSCEHFEEGVHPGRSRPNRCSLTGASLGAAELQVDCVSHKHRRGDVAAT